MDQLLLVKVVGLACFTELSDLDDVFESLQEEPLGSASVAQAHVGVLRDGTEVVVKVQ